MSGTIVINEVGPRDGLQSQAGELTLEERRAFIEALLGAGLRHIEIGSFVSPKAVPQMAGTGDLARALAGKADAELSALVPNMKGYELAREAGVKTVAVVVSATETMNQRNINMSLADTVAVAREVIARGREEGVAVQAYLAVAFECPFEGAVAREQILPLATELADAGASLLVIADTRALGLANVYAGIEAGVRRFDASVGGLGGCPFAPGARGNVATEDVAMLCEQLGFGTGIDMAALLGVVDQISGMLGRAQGGRALEWLRRSVNEAA